MPTFGKVEEYKTTESWQEYIERLECYFEANDIVAAKRAIIFLSVCGPTTYSILRSLVSPKTPKSIPYKDIVAALGNHFNPKPSAIVSRFHFNQYRQGPTQKLVDFVAELRRLSEHCEFGDQLENMLRDRLVCGVNDPQLQRQLLAIPNLTFTKAQEDAVAMEAAFAQMKDLRPSPPNDVHEVHTSRSKRSTERTPGATCFRCGGHHSPKTCRWINEECRYCCKIGHIERVCLAKKKEEGENKSRKVTKHAPWGGKTKTHFVEQVSTDDIYGIFSISNASSVTPPFKTKVVVEGVPHEFQVDSGSVRTIMADKTFQNFWPRLAKNLQHDSIGLRTWSHAKLKVSGTMLVSVEYGSQKKSLPLTVVEGLGTSLLGRDWFEALGIGLTGILNISVGSVETIVNEFAEVFQDELGAFKGPPVSIDIDKDVTPRFLKPRKLPFALQPRVSEELDNLLKQGVLTPVRHSRWATPIVPVVKHDKSIRICGDYKCTVNRAVTLETYPLPTIKEMLASLTGGVFFSNLDMKQAYQQLTLDDDSAHLLTINTHKGLFKVNRLQFGVSSAVAIFQRFTETLLAGLEGVKPYLDDIIIMGRDEDEHHSRLREVLRRLADAGLRLQKSKCKFAVNELEFLGFKISNRGVHPTAQKVRAVQEATTPQNRAQLQAFLGLINFYACFLKNRASVLEPLHRLLDKGAEWSWTTRHAEAYAEAKKMLQTDKVLVHYDESRPLFLVCDASPYGVGAVLSHKGSDGQEAPIAFASRTLTSAERNYAQLDREALSLVYGVTYFHQYLYGRSFEMFTDHKPLLGLLNEAKPIPQIISPRMLRWSLLLGAYDYKLTYRSGKLMGNADALSRLPITAPDSEVPAPADVLLLEAGENFPVTAEDVAKWTTKDRVLSRVLFWTLHGWPEDRQPEEYQPFVSRAQELSIHKGCILWGTRVVLPEAARPMLLETLHSTHPGIVNMKALARSYVWWPNIDADVERVVKNCSTCQESRHAPARAPTHSWEWTTKPWSRLHLDFAGPLDGHIYLIVVDSHSKWLEVFRVTSMSSITVIKILRRLFVTHGLPNVIVSDNGTAFTSTEFKSFAARNAIRLTTSSPYHPSSNGQAERMVQTAKEAIKRMSKAEDFEIQLSRFLLAQHNTPSATTGKCPAELLMGRRIATLLDRVHPDLTASIHRRQEDADRGKTSSVTRILSPGDLVNYRNFTQTGPRWVPGEIVEATGPVSYKTRTSNGSLVRRHIDQLRSSANTHHELQTTVPDLQTTTHADQPTSPDNPTTPATTASPPSARPQRNKQAPAWMQDFSI